MMIVKWSFIVGVTLVSELCFAQSVAEKSFAEQLKIIQDKDVKSQKFQGEIKDAQEVLQSAKSRSHANANFCPAGSVDRKPEDVANYLRQQDEFHKKFAISMARFSSNEIGKNAAIRDLNALVNDSNILIVWGHGKVTNGTCGPEKITDLIGKADNTTNNLIQDYKKMLGFN